MIHFRVPAPEAPNLTHITFLGFGRASSARLFDTTFVLILTTPRSVFGPAFLCPIEARPRAPTCACHRRLARGIFERRDWLFFRLSCVFFSGDSLAVPKTNILCQQPAPMPHVVPLRLPVEAWTTGTLFDSSLFWCHFVPSFGHTFFFKMKKKV